MPLIKNSIVACWNTSLRTRRNKLMKHVFCEPSSLTGGEERRTTESWVGLFFDRSGFGCVVTWAGTKRMLRFFLGPPPSTLPCNVLVFTITGSVHLIMSQPCWGAAERSCKDTDWLTYPHCIQIKVFVRLQHTDRARPQPSPPNSWILLCFFYSVCAVWPQIKIRLGFEFYFSLAQCTFCHVVCVLRNVSADIFGRVEESTHSRANTMQRQDVLFAEPITFQRALAPHLLHSLTTRWCICGNLICRWMAWWCSWPSCMPGIIWTLDC